MFQIISLILLVITPSSNQLVQVAVNVKLFSCDDGSTIRSEHFCDSVTHCADESDEIIGSNLKKNKVITISIRCPFFSCQSFLTNRSCHVTIDHICNGIVTCKNISPCQTSQCASKFYLCDDGVTCLPRSTLCDEDACNDCHQGAEWANGAGFKCVRNGRTCILPQSLLFDDVQDCDNGDDFCFVVDRITGAKTLNEINCFRCLHDNVLISRSKVCDGEIDCFDLSDECLCIDYEPNVCHFISKNLKEDDEDENENPCENRMLNCGDGKCLQMSLICDGRKDCWDARDEDYEFCRGTLPCVEGSLLQKGQSCRCYKPCASEMGVLCDERGDCPPIEGDGWLDEPGYPDDECSADCSLDDRNQFNCTHPLPAMSMDLPYQDFMECYEELPPPQTGFHIFTLDSTRWCDGKVDCPPDGADETKERCPNRFHCRSSGGVNIEKDRVCDGIIDCDNNEDENNETCGAIRHFCPVLGSTKVSIDRSLICDLHINCDDNSDEIDCHNDGRFYCESGEPLFVEKRKRFDGKTDCSDWSDECPIKSKALIGDLISSKYELVATPVLRYFVWVMALFAVTGNTLVIFDLIKALRCCSSSSTATNSKKLFKFNAILVLNLACADLIMGIYLIMLGSNITLHSGLYCSKKIQWLSGDICKLMGTLVVISSQTSVFTMVFLTTVRLIAVIQPFRSAQLLSTRCICILLMMTWLASFVLAIIPQLHLLQSIFQEKAVLSENPFLLESPAHFAAVKRFSIRFTTFAMKNESLSEDFIHSLLTASSWDELYNLMKIISDKKHFWMTSNILGYYSYNSVCIPNIFAKRSDKSWWFSCIIAIINFSSFFYVAISYAYIYCRSQENPTLKVSTIQRHQQVLQKRILRLVLTDFLCWFPVCVMAFLNLSGILVPDIAYGVSAIILLPINSALNPIIYSKSFEKVFQRISKSRRASTRSTESFSVFFTKTSVRLGFRKKEVAKKASNASSNLAVIS